MNLDLNIQDPRWAALDLAQLAQTAISTSLVHFILDTDISALSILACNDQRITVLNDTHRAKPSATNVLSWPSADLANPIDGATPAPPKPDFSGDLDLGDIAIAWETCAREANEANKDMTDHVTHLLVHGLLHLLGYDHIRDADATLMMENEIEILGKLGIDNPY